MAQSPGKLTFEINRVLVGDGVTATEEEVARAVAFAFRELKLVVEPGGAVGLAALLAGSSTSPARPPWSCSPAAMSIPSCSRASSRDEVIIASVGWCLAELSRGVWPSITARVSRRARRRRFRAISRRAPSFSPSCPRSSGAAPIRHTALTHSSIGTRAEFRTMW